MSVGHANFFHVLSSDTLLHLTVDAPTTFASQITTCPPQIFTSSYGHDMCT